MSEIDRIREDNKRSRDKCVRCGEERQSHAFVQGVYGSLWICQSAVFSAVSRPPQTGVDRLVGRIIADGDESALEAHYTQTVRPPEPPQEKQQQRAERAGRPMPPPESDAEVIVAIRGVLWDALRGRDIGGDRTLVGMVKRLVFERDEARENRRGEFELRIEADAQIAALREALETLRWVRVTCGACGDKYRQCASCGEGTIYAGAKWPGSTNAQCGGHPASSPCEAGCVVARALAAPRREE